MCLLVISIRAHAITAVAMADRSSGPTSSADARTDPGHTGTESGLGARISAGTIPEEIASFCHKLL